MTTILNGNTILNAGTTIEAWSPSVLFAAGEQGAWYDPSDLNTMFQDEAGTIPVTAVEQPVGRILDKSGRGNHATQATAGSRPTLSARVNLLTKTEQFQDTGAWATAGRATIAANDTTAPDGTTTADRITETTDNGTHRVYQQFTWASNTTYTEAIYWKKGTRRWVWISAQDAENNSRIQFYDLDNIAVGSTVGASTQITKVSASITDVGNGWRRCVFTISVGTVNGAGMFVGYFTGLASDDGTVSYVGTTSDYNWLWGADLRVSNVGVGLPPYQRVNTSTDYDTAGFPLYLKFDGSASSMATGSIDLTAANKVTVFAGGRKASDAAIAAIAELSTSGTANSGTFSLFAPPSVAANYSFRSRGNGTNLTAQTASSYPAPITNILTGVGDIPGDNMTLRVNGSVAATNTGDQGTGNYGNYPLYIGARAGSSLYFNGNLYGLIVRGASSTAGQISAAETWLNGKTRAY